jgi:hypothetical protein
MRGQRRWLAECQHKPFHYWLAPRFICTETKWRQTNDANQTNSQGRWGSSKPHFTRKYRYGINEITELPQSLSLFVARNRTGASQTLSRVFPWCRDTHFRTIHSDNIELRTSKFSSYQLPSAPMQHAESCQILQRPPLMPLGRMKMQFGTFWNSPRESSNTPLAPADSRRQEDTSAGSALLSYRENSLEYGPI